MHIIIDHGQGHDQVIVTLITMNMSYYDMINIIILYGYILIIALHNYIITAFL